MAGLGGVESLLGKPGTTCFFLVTQQFTVGTSVTKCFQGSESCSISLSFCLPVNHHTLKVREGSYPLGHAVSNHAERGSSLTRDEKDTERPGPRLGWALRVLPVSNFLDF